MTSTPALYEKHRLWALSLVGPERWDRAQWEEERAMALAGLWVACRQWEGGPGFREFARPRIEEALRREYAG